MGSAPRYIFVATVALALGILIGASINGTDGPAVAAKQEASFPTATPTASATPTATPTLAERRAVAKRQKAQARKEAETRRHAAAKAETRLRREKAEAAAARAAVRERHRRYVASLTKTFSGNGGLTIPPFTLSRGSTLTWTNDGGYFGIYDTDGVPVNSSASHGKTYVDSGRHKLQVNAVGSWTIKITPSD